MSQEKRNKNVGKVELVHLESHNSILLISLHNASEYN